MSSDARYFFLDHFRKEFFQIGHTVSHRSALRINMASNECANVMEEFQTKLDGLVDLMKETRDIRQLWQKALALWKKTIESLITMKEGAFYEDCSDIFLTKVYFGLNFGQRLEKDGALCYEVFYSCLDELNRLVVDQHHLTSDSVEQLHSNTIGKYFRDLLFLSWMSCNFVPFTSELVSKYMRYLTMLKTYADEKVMRELASKQDQFDSVITHILIFFWCMANRTVLVPSLIQLDLARSAVQWLANCTCLNAEATEPIIRIIYNMARHDDGADEYNKLGTMDVVKQYQKR